MKHWNKREKKLKLYLFTLLIEFIMLLCSFLGDGPAPIFAINSVSSQSMTPDYTPTSSKMTGTSTTTSSAYPVMDTTVASSVKGEPELNIGKHWIWSLYHRLDNGIFRKFKEWKALKQILMLNWTTENKPVENRKQNIEQMKIGLLDHDICCGILESNAQYLFSLEFLHFDSIRFTNFRFGLMQNIFFQNPLFHLFLIYSILI